LYPENKAKDPNTTANDLLSLSLYYPDEVLSNPILPLIALENPALWNQIVDSAYRTKETNSHQRKQLSQQSVQRQEMTLRFLLEMMMWLVGILLLILLLSSSGAPQPLRSLPHPARM
jgi:hypothetical protein